ncbi:dual specificity protein phosphatase [Trichonephila clavata]|uniref:Dual specificity protein phosphatase n=1 Tax=Trichonephila clavata TaxID=2740835 RepID=A0A8X6FFN2_TRICU|nr:dual specificity protein phosphatase [Trichonephila clavata]
MIVLYEESTNPFNETYPTLEKIYSYLIDARYRVVLLEGGFSEYKKTYPWNCERSYFREEFLLPFVDHLNIQCTFEYEVEEYLQFYPSPVEVLPNLYIGNAICSANINELLDCGISYILNVTPEVPNKFEGMGLGIIYKRIPIRDSFVDIFDYFEEAAAFIENLKGKKGNSPKGI